jgi:hypothetical protein
MYALDGIAYGILLLILGLLLYFPYQTLRTSRRLSPQDTYIQIDISSLQKGQTWARDYHGSPIVIRRLAYEEVNDTHYLDAKLEKKGELGEFKMRDVEGYVGMSEYGDSMILVLGKPPDRMKMPVLGGELGGWVSEDKGDLYDKFGRNRGKRRGCNMIYVNHTLHGDVLCLEEYQFPQDRNFSQLLV